MNEQEVRMANTNTNANAEAEKWDRFAAEAAADGYLRVARYCRLEAERIRLSGERHSIIPKEK